MRRWLAPGSAKPVCTAIALIALIGVLVGDTRRVAGQALTRDAIRVACATNPVVLDVSTKLAYPPWGPVSGTGVIIDGAGDVLTNNHVVAGAATVALHNPSDGRDFLGEVVATDVVDDLALIRLSGVSGLAGATLGDSTQLAVGQRVYAIGNGQGGCGMPRITTGRVVALNQALTVTNRIDGNALRLNGLIRTDARVEPGFSGGALVDDRARVVGILTAGHTPESCGCYRSAFAIPIAKAALIAAQMRAGTRTETVHVGPTASLGVTAAGTSDVSDDSFITGALVTYLAPGSPAERLGLQLGNQIVSFAGRPVRSALDLVLALQEQRPGQKVTIGWTDASWRPRAGTTVLASGPPQ